MGQLKPSEVRLLIIFTLTVLVLGSFFLYEWYARRLNEVKAEKVELIAKRDSLRTLRTQQNEYNQKRAWMNNHQLVARDELEAKEMLDRVVSLRGIEAAGLTLVSSPPEKAPRLEPHYWAFERRVVVQGGIQNIVQWLVQLQSETSFRVITHLHLYPKKKKEPEELTCEVTIEQRYATEEIVNASVGGPALASMTATPSTPSSSPTTDDGAGAPPAAAPSTPETPPSELKETRRVIVPSPGGNPPPPGGRPEVSRPRVRLPGSPSTPAAGDETSMATGNLSTGMLANVRRGRAERGPIPPPPMDADIAEAEARAVQRGLPMPDQVRTGTELAQEAVGDVVDVVKRDPVSVPVDRGLDDNGPAPRGTFESVSLNGVVGEDWNENTPGAGGPDAAVGMEDGLPDTN